MVDEDFQRVYTRHKHINSQVEFETVYKVGFADVPLNYGSLVKLNILYFFGQEYSLALGE